MVNRRWADLIKPSAFWCLNRIVPRFSPHQARILAYHEVPARRPLEDQLRWIREGGYRGVSLHQLLSCLTSHQPLPERAVALTFDDGYLDQFTHGAPLLLEYGFTATFFVLGDRRKGICYWEGEGMELPRRPLMGVQELRQLSRSGFEIGCHGLTHRQLTRLTRSDQQREILEGRSRLENDLGLRITLFSYPYGDMNTEVASLVQEAGFEGGVSTVRGPVTSGDDPFKLRRMTVIGADRRAEFKAYLTGTMVSYLDFRDRLRNFSG
ncbi:MAG: polysaccharide deacetylase family protein [Acidobacteria bacterium]|nr:polysaccharide deacetylase family protein [Acidobacteriota bacterium]